MANALLPSIQLFTNNQGGDSIRYENCQFNMKRKGKQAAYFKCITKDCQASLSLTVKDDKTKKANLCKGRNINEVIVKNKLTADGKNLRLVFI